MKARTSVAQARVWASSFALVGGLFTGVAFATEAPASADVDAAAQVESGSSEAAAEFKELRKGALSLLEGEQRSALDAMSDADLMALLNKPEGTKLGETEEALVGAFHRHSFERTLKYQTGEVQVGDGLASLKLSDQFRYLDPQESQRLLVDAWGNPPGGESLGMILPSDVSPLHAKKGWGVVITYTEEGHVEDDDAEDIDYDELLEQMQEDTKASSEERVKMGYEAIELVGWAEPPHYDGDTNRLYWAKELAFADGAQHTLNYSIRILGRKGVLELNAVAGMSQLGQVKRDMQKVLPLAEFKAGQTYSDFNPDLDDVAAYGIGGLIAGKVLTKVGLFAGLLKLLVVFKKALILGAIGIGAFVAKVFKGRNAG